MKLQLNCFATVVNSSKLAPEIKEQILTTTEGKVKKLRVQLTDSEGNVFVLGGPLKLSKKGSLTSCCLLKLESFELITIDDPKSDKLRKTKEEKTEETVDQLASELLG